MSQVIGQLLNSSVNVVRKISRVIAWLLGTMLLATIALIVTILISYPFAGHFSMPIQVSAHIGTLLFATVIKLSYVLRLVSLKSLGRPVH